MISKYKFNNTEKYSVWQTHGFKCYWCGVPLELMHVSIDHLLPENLSDKPDEFQRIKNHYLLPETFKINDFCNWVPTHNNCNSKKGHTIFNNSPAFLAFITDVIKKSDQARNTYQKLVVKRNKDKIIGKIVSNLEQNYITNEDLILLLKDTCNIQEVETKTSEIRIKIAGEWKVISTNNNLAVVSNGHLVGITPTSRNPDVSWTCPYCGSLGPWSGVRCLTCGRMSDPND